jgi:hypothetical protein
MKKKAAIPIVTAAVIAVVLVAIFASPAETPTAEPDLVASFAERWNTLAEDTLPHLDLSITVEGLIIVADGAQSTTYEFRFWDGPSKGEYHKVSLSLAKEGNPYWKAGTIRASVGANRPADSEHLVASWGLLIAAMMPDGTLAEAGDILRELEVIESDVDLTNIWRETTRGGFVFGFEGFEAFSVMYGYEL